MSFNNGERIYKIFIKVMQEPDYNEIAKNFKSSHEELQNQSQNFTPEQWDAINHYLDSFTKVYETMMTIALEGHT